MFANSYFAQTSGIQVSSLPINLMKLEGYFSGAAQAWLQVFDSCNAPQAGAVPKREFALFATAPFYEEFKNGAMGMSAAFDGTYNDLHDLCVAVLGADPDSPDEYALAKAEAISLRTRVKDLEAELAKLSAAAMRRG